MVQKLIRITPGPNYVHETGNEWSEKIVIFNKLTTSPSEESLENQINSLKIIFRDCNIDIYDLVESWKPATHERVRLG